LYHIYPSLLHSNRMGSPCTMAASAQSLTQVSLVGEREEIPPASTVGLGVTEAAFDMFSNFVEHIASNVGNTSDRAENMVSTRSQLRRSVRFASAQTCAPDPCPATLPTPLVAKVRATVCAPSVIAGMLGFEMPRAAIGLLPLHGHGSLFHGHGQTSWPLFCWLVDVQGIFCLHVATDVVRGAECRRHCSSREGIHLC
jgi:hypothetical protein